MVYFNLSKPSHHIWNIHIILITSNLILLTIRTCVKSELMSTIRNLGNLFELFVEEQYLHLAARLILVVWAWRKCHKFCGQSLVLI